MILPFDAESGVVPRIVFGIILRHSSARWYASTERFLRYHHENAYLLVKGNPPFPAVRIPDVIEWKYSGNRLHPTQKPLCILSPLSRSFSRPGDFVVDPFCGSGSTLLAAKLAGRRYLGVELDANYSMQATKRLACWAA